MKYIERHLDKEEILKRISYFPVTAIIGPRQSGKTTLAHMLNPDVVYDLENPADVAALENPVLQLQRTKGLVVIDEIQRKPELFTTLRFLCDTRKDVRFCILGSASPDLIKKSSETLAGRISYYVLMGFRKDDLPEDALQHFHFRGSFPRSLLAPDDAMSNQWRKDYIKTYCERDLPLLGIRIPAYTMHKFWQMLAHYHANIINYSELGRSFGVSDVTIRHYIDILAGTFMVRLLQPFYANIGKRLVKRPKVYIRDSGILHTLLLIENSEQLYRHPKVGASWEGFALEAVCRALQKNDEEVFFYSVQSGAEIDLVWQHDGSMWGCEFKFQDAPVKTKSMVNAVQDLNIKKLWVIYPGSKEYNLAENIVVMPFEKIPVRWIY
ncbi:MAG: ATP-binding protein [Spirochaetota bacterium]